MKAADMEAVGINLALVAWLARHSKDVPAILAGAQAVVSAATIAEKWGALKSVGDLVVADLSDFPGSPHSPTPVNPPAPNPPGPIGPIGPVSTVSVAQLDAALTAIGDGHIINAIVSLVTNPQFLAILELILKLAGVAIV